MGGASAVPRLPGRFRVEHLELRGMADGKHLVFVTKPTGYELHERDGEAPTTGSDVEVDGEGRFRVAKVASSPLPGDDRRCAYLVPA